MTRHVGRIITSFFFFIFVWTAGLIWFAAQIPTSPAYEYQQAGAIVVLTGGAGRVDQGLQRLLAGRGEKLFVSGANKEVTHDDIVAMAPSKKQDAVRKMAGSKIILGNNAENTIGNAEETRRWLKNTPYKSILLVTSAYHMPRSLSEFREVMPRLIIIPDAVMTQPITSKWWLHDYTRKLVLSEYHKYLIGKFRHWYINNMLVNTLT